jgi:hypothetical protein
MMEALPAVALCPSALPARKTTLPAGPPVACPVVSEIDPDGPASAAPVEIASSPDGLDCDDPVWTVMEPLDPLVAELVASDTLPLVVCPWPL